MGIAKVVPRVQRLREGKWESQRPLEGVPVGRRHCPKVRLQVWKVTIQAVSDDVMQGIGGTRCHCAEQSQTEGGRGHSDRGASVSVDAGPSDGGRLQGPFTYQKEDLDSSAVTFWGTRDLRPVLRQLLTMLDEHYERTRLHDD